MRVLSEGSLVFTEDTNIRKRRTIVMVPTDQVNEFLLGWSECGPDDTFNRETGIREANKRANSAKWAIQNGKELPAGSGQIKVHMQNVDRKEFVREMQDALYDMGFLRTENSIDMSDIFRIIRHTRNIEKSLKPFLNELSEMTDGVPKNGAPPGLKELGLAAISLYREVEKWKHLNPQAEVVMEEAFFLKSLSPAPDSPSEGTSGSAPQPESAGKTEATQNG